MENRLVQLNGNRMSVAEYARTTWAVTAQPDTTREDLLKPDYWAHVASKFNSLDRLEVRSDDGAFFAEYLILTCERTYAKVKELSWFDLKGEEVALPDESLEEFEYKFRGPHSKHSVVRKSDSKVMVEKLQSKDEALRWITNYKKAA